MNFTLLSFRQLCFYINIPEVCFGMHPSYLQTVSSLGVLILYLLESEQFYSRLKILTLHASFLFSLPSALGVMKFSNSTGDNSISSNPEWVLGTVTSNTIWWVQIVASKCLRQILANLVGEAHWEGSETMMLSKRGPSQTETKSIIYRIKFTSLS